MRNAYKFIYSGLIAIAATPVFGAGGFQSDSAPAPTIGDSPLAPPSPRDARELGIGRYIADPSGVVSADFRMSLLTLKDGRQLSGVIAATNARTLTLRTLTEPLTLDRSEIVKQETSPMSMMPEGLLLALQPDQVRDLIAYLMHPVQVK